MHYMMQTRQTPDGYHSGSNSDGGHDRTAEEDRLIAAGKLTIPPHVLLTREQYQTRAAKHAQEGKRDAELALYRWMLEEYRVSLFAQQLGTKMAVSDKRLSKQWTLVES